MIITQTPLRISFAGGGTDFPDYFTKSYGNVVSTTIDKYIYVIVKKRFDNCICIGYSKQETVFAVSEIKHELIREAMKYFDIQPGIEIKTMSDIPSEGSGLGSSSSLLVGTIKALSEYKGVSLNQDDIARIACDIEVGILKKPIGWQDQYAASYGGFNYYRFELGKVDVSVVSYDRELQECLMLFFTGVTRQSSGILQEQNDKITDNIENLNRIRDIAYVLKDNITLDTIGNSIRDSWNIKIQLASGITNPAINKMICDAINAGALGAKILGAGGGGFLLVCCSVKDRQQIRNNLNYLEELPFAIEKYGSRVIFNVEK